MRRAFVAALPAAIALVLLAGCTAPAPAPTPTPSTTIAAPSATPTPGPEPEAAPDLAALCEQLLPLETVQERFGADVALNATAPSARAQLAEWSAVARGDLLCRWSASDPSNGLAAAEIIARRADGGAVHLAAKERIASWASQPDQGGVDAELDRFGDSVDACAVDRCEYSVLTADGTWLWLAVQMQDGSEQTIEQVRAAADVDADRLAAGIDGILSTVEAPRLVHPTCDELISLEQARGITGDDTLQSIDALASSGWNPTILSSGPAALIAVERCDRVDPADGQGISVRYASVPQSIRERAFRSVVEAVGDGTADARTGARIEIEGAQAAWRFCFDEGGCGVDLLAQGVWMQIHAEDALLVPAAEAIVANLTS